MIILTNSTDKITAKLGGAVTTNQMRTFASYRDTTSNRNKRIREIIL